MKPESLLLTLALFLAACQSDETTDTLLSQRVPLTFEAYVEDETHTRATDDPTGNLNMTTLRTAGFGVYAYTEDFDPSDPSDHSDYSDLYTGSYNAATSLPLLMCNQPVKYEEGRWTYTPMKYWPNQEGSKVTLFAYAPYVKASDPTLTLKNDKNSPGDPKITYTRDLSLTNIDDQIDLLWGVDPDTGKPYIDKERRTSLNDDGYSVESRVNFRFRHALAKVSLWAVSMSKDIKITSISLKCETADQGFYTTGTLNLNNTTAWNPKWEDLGTQKKKTFTQSMDYTVTKEKKRIDAWNEMLFLPQTFDASNPLKLSVTFQPTGESETTTEITLPTTTTFVANRDTRILISFSDRTKYIAVSVTSIDSFTE